MENHRKTAEDLQKLVKNNGKVGEIGRFRTASAVLEPFRAFQVPAGQARHREGSAEPSSGL